MKPPRSLYYRIVWLFVLVLPVAAAAQPELSDPDDAETAGDDALETSLHLYPVPIWSNTSGFAAGLGYEIKNLIVPRTSILAVAKPGQHLGRYALTYSVRNAYEDSWYVLASAYYETTGRHWYYGIHSNSFESERIAVEKEMVEVEIGLGVRPFGGTVLLQPSAKYIRHAVHGFESFEDGALSRLSDLSREYLFYSVGETEGGLPNPEGYGLGISGGVDFRDRPGRPHAGILLQGSFFHYRFSASPRNLIFDHYQGFLYGYLPVGDNTLAIRIVVKNENHLSRAIIPFYMHPMLDGLLLPGYSRYRFYGNDLLVVTAEYSMPMFQLRDFAAMDVLISLGAGNVYYDLFGQFTPSIAFDNDSFSQEVTVAEVDVPMRPSAAAGINLQSDRPGGWNMRVLLGWGTEGIGLVTFGFVHDVRLPTFRKR